MPCYLFTFHGYGTWYPEREEGFVHRQNGQLPSDLNLASKYRERACEKTVIFKESQQQALIDESQVATDKQGLQRWFVATETTHIHLLLSWRDDREWLKIRTGIKTSLTRRLNREFMRRTWLSDGGSRRQVKNQEHYDYLVCTYLPSHRGWKWSAEKGLHR